MTIVGQLESDDNPAWLLEPPDNAEIAPPIDTLAQELPFGGLTWQNFERLCRSLASFDGDVEYCRLYGTAGQEQGGIDIYVRRTSTAKYASWQSKRHKSFGPLRSTAPLKSFLTVRGRKRAIASYFAFKPALVRLTFKTKSKNVQFC
jgi:hypothetical protein